MKETTANRVFIATRDSVGVSGFCILSFFWLGYQSDIMFLRRQTGSTYQNVNFLKDGSWDWLEETCPWKSLQKITQTHGNFNQLIRHMFIFNSRIRGCHGDLKTLFSRGIEFRSNMPLHHNVLLKQAKSSVFWDTWFMNAWINSLYIFIFWWFQNFSNPILEKPGSMFASRNYGLSFHRLWLTFHRLIFQILLLTLLWGLLWALYLMCWLH